MIRIIPHHLIVKALQGPLMVPGGNGNHSVSLPIILIKIKVDQMLPSSYISWSLFYDIAFDFLFS